ncbi:MAG: non-homologous end-joining DNA ligase [Planctomycetaceae bacterium]|nr:non-homologous end-joining DNA ligase [Planctomycetaceae bacterium]
MALDEYRRKRRFSRTPEPRGQTRRASSAALRFVVQEHDATRLHFDFRLELDGVLKSWAVPKGPSLDPAEKRLAVAVEDHPLEYGDFEGTIPPGEYGGGTVLLWDRGVWTPEADPHQGFREGKLKFTLDGEKLRGGWTLVRMRTRDRAGRNWLLIKERDRFARSAPKRDVTVARSRSVKSGQSLAQIAAATADPIPARATAKASHRSAAKAIARQGTGKKSATSGVDPADDQIAGVRLSSPERIVFAEQGLTKRDLAEYYVAIADWILPHLVGRPLALLRCPRGQGKGCFYQKHPGAGAPSTLDRVPIDEKRKRVEYAVVNDLAGLVSLVQMGVLEIHPWGSRVDKLEYPDRLIFDLDPDPAVPWPEVVRAARELRELLAELQLEAFLKTTGGKGLHVVVPIERRVEWPVAKQFTREVVQAMIRRRPGRYTANLLKAERRGKIFLDYLRNDRGATAIAAYSTRARPKAPVATPITWDELGPRLHADHFDTARIIRRLAALTRDPWQDFRSTRQGLTVAAIKRLAQL